MNFESTVENGTCLFPVVNQQCPLVLEKQQVLTKRAKQQPFKAEWMVMRLKHSWIVECIFYLPMVLLCHSQHPHRSPPHSNRYSHPSLFLLAHPR